MYCSLSYRCYVCLAVDLSHDIAMATIGPDFFLQNVFISINPQDVRFHVYIRLLSSTASSLHPNTATTNLKKIFYIRHWGTWVIGNNIFTGFYSAIGVCVYVCERNVLFNDALNTFYLRLYGVRHMVKDHSD